MLPFKRPKLLTKDCCYQLARLYWRQWAKRGKKDHKQTFIDFNGSLRVNGYSSEDIQQIKQWADVFVSGRRFP